MVIANANRIGNCNLLIEKADPLESWKCKELEQPQPRKALSKLLPLSRFSGVSPGVPFWCY